jgi:hypothetical protein
MNETIARGSAHLSLSYGCGLLKSRYLRSLGYFMIMEPALGWWFSVGQARKGDASSAAHKVLG